MHPVPVYSLSPRQIVDAMFLQHGQTTGPDLQKLRDPLLKLLPALAQLETHMTLFILASVKLTASGHGETLTDTSRCSSNLSRASPCSGSSYQASLPRTLR
jgi:hypothetical protein